MIGKHYHLAVNRKRSEAGQLAGRLPQFFAIMLGFVIVIWGVTLSTPNTSSTRLFPIAPPSTISSQPQIAASKNQVPVLVYYYIWFDHQSWDRAKQDYPVLGRYSSNNAYIMRRHIRWAKAAGINGFIVSWKGTDKLNRRLSQLVEIADQENFKLAIIYESLDFERNPLPVEQVDADLNYFISHYVDHPAFDLFAKPVIIWSGSWKFSTDEIKSVVRDTGQQVFVLASEKNVKGYERVADIVDGDAYYWSSVDPDTHPGYEDKLTTMGEAVHESGGLWIAPAAPGYDSRLLGGTTVVDRENGETLRTQLTAAAQSHPDAIGIISWNEFSENSYIEPSQKYGHLYLKVLAEAKPLILNPQ